ncbi:MAG TPA: protein kinase, partial [Streptosporangiaceae bacterium]
MVWRARDELLHRDVAVKEIVLPPHLEPAERDVARQRALREAQMAARLSHPNVVGIYDVVVEDDRPWIVMELVPYRSLRELVMADGPLSPGQAAQVGLGILAALKAAHARGVLHRDVKPANVLLAPGGRVVLTDFGIARATDSPVLTGTGVLVGSPSYIAPERARGGPAAASADLWALGACLYAAVEGRPPFDREGALASLTAVVTDEPDPPARAGPLWPVISGLLRKDPEERLSADQAGQLLEQLTPAEAEPWAEPEPDGPAGTDAAKPATEPVPAAADTGHSAAAGQDPLGPGTDDSPTDPGMAPPEMPLAEAAPFGAAPPEAAPLEAAVPEAAVPKEALPEEALPEEAASEGAAPVAAAPVAAASEAAASVAAASEEAAPEQAPAEVQPSETAPPEAAPPEEARSEIAPPLAAQPLAAQPEVAQPAAAQPEVERTAAPAAAPLPSPAPGRRRGRVLVAAAAAAVVIAAIVVSV